jgi:hypothetical protein
MSKHPTELEIWRIWTRYYAELAAEEAAAAFYAPGDPCCMAPDATEHPGCPCACHGPRVTDAPEDRCDPAPLDGPHGLGRRPRVRGSGWTCCTPTAWATTSPAASTVARRTSGCGRGRPPNHSILARLAPAGFGWRGHCYLALRPARS